MSGKVPTSLVEAWVEKVRAHPGAAFSAEAGRPSLTRIRMLTGAILIAKALRSAWADQDCVAILLPATTAGGLANLAGALAGKTLVNLNFTAGASALASALEQCGCDKILTSRLFLKRAKLELPDAVELIHLEDLQKGMSQGGKLLAMLQARFQSVAGLQRSCGARRPSEMEDVATIIFSSGSEDAPKGVMLTHRNLWSDLRNSADYLELTGEEYILGSLPLFHSFGTLLFWIAALEGPRIYFFANPLDASALGKAVQEQKLTVLVTTPTFLQIYIRRCTLEQFASLRLVVTGAEQLPDRVAEAFEDKFGTPALQGYGTTECSPVVAVNRPDANKQGSVGCPIPEVEIRIEDPDTHDARPVGDEGMILVKGPNIMKGYLGREDLTAKVLREGWYVTGDIGYVDEDGFLFITGRLSRFSKIGGEMVPHVVVEDALHESLQAEERVVAVTAVPDPKKGEKLVVLHTLDPERIPSLIDALSKRGLPNLYIPRPADFVHVDDLPLLGSGKLDLKRVQSLAAQARP